MHFMRNVLVRARAGQWRLVSALFGTIFAQETEAAARPQWRTVADQLPCPVASFPCVPKRRGRAASVNLNP
jgi:hypothetical protein